MPNRLLSICVLTLSAALAGFAQTNPLTVNPGVLSFSYQTGAATLPAAATMQVQSAPAGLNFNVSISGTPFNAAWLLVSASSGKAPAALKVQVNPTGLPAGTYTGTLTFSATVNAQTVTKSATVTLFVTTPPPAISANPASLSFHYTTGGPIPAPSLTSAFILSSSGSALTASVSVKGATWLSVAPTGNVTLVGLLNTITVTADPTGLPPKVYTGQITISAPGASNKTLAMNVTLTVNAAPPKITGNWPGGVIQASPPSVVTLEGSSFYSNSTVSATGFTPEATITVNDGVNTVSQPFFIPTYASSATGLRLNVASPLPTGTVGSAYSRLLAGGGGTGPYTYALMSGSLPPGLTISGSSITGTPTAAGTYLPVIQVTDHGTPPATAYAELKLTVYPTGSNGLRITVANTPLSLGIVGAAYPAVNLTVVGGSGGPYTWTATNLPAGLTLSSSGVLIGTPSTDGASGAVSSTVVSDSGILATVPAADLVNAGILRLAVTTPSPGGGTSNEAQFRVYGPGPQILAVTNSASLSQGTLAPGELITLFGIGLGPATLTVFDPSVPPIPTSLPTSGSATSVTINGTAAPVIYTMSTQAGVIVPYSVTGTSAQVVASYAGAASQAFTVTLAPTDPGVYSLAATGQGPGAILNYNATTGDYTVNSTTAPALRGSTIVLYITGAGATSSSDYSHLIPASPAVTPNLPVSVSIGTQGATVLAAQAPPGSVPGLIQVNVTVPSTAPVGVAVPVVVTIGGVSSQTGLTVAIK